jgi:hypothetical protein
MRPRLRAPRRLKRHAKISSRIGLIRTWERQLESLEKYDLARPNAFDWFVYDLIPFYAQRDHLEAVRWKMSSHERTRFTRADLHFLSMTQDDTEGLVADFVGEMEGWLPTDSYSPLIERWWYSRVPRRGVVLELLRGDADHAEPTFWDRAYLTWQRRGEEIDEQDSGVPSSTHVQLRLKALATPRDFIKPLRDRTRVEWVKLQLVQTFHAAAASETTFVIDHAWLQWLADRNGFVDIDQYVDFEESDDWPLAEGEELLFARAGVAWGRVATTSTVCPETQLSSLLDCDAHGTEVHIWQRFLRGRPATTGLGIDVPSVKRLAEIGASLRIKQTVEDNLG